jgi:hypothetical protein
VSLSFLEVLHLDVPELAQFEVDGGTLTRPQNGGLISMILDGVSGLGKLFTK